MDIKKIQYWLIGGIILLIGSLAILYMQSIQSNLNTTKKLINLIQDISDNQLEKASVQEHSLGQEQDQNDNTDYKNDVQPAPQQLTVQKKEVIVIDNSQTLQKLLTEHKQPAVFFLHMNGCGWCKKMDPVFKAVAENPLFNTIQFYDVNGPELGAAAMVKNLFGQSVNGYPFILFLNQDGYLEKQAGFMHQADFIKKLQSLYPKSKPQEQDTVVVQSSTDNSVCTQNSDCQSGCCYGPSNSSGVCTASCECNPLILTGDTCWNDGQCQTSYCYFQYGAEQPGICSNPPQPNGALCTEDSNCLSNYCILDGSGVMECSCGPADGCTCGTNSDCNSGNCYLGFCKQPEPAAMCCWNNGQCASKWCYEQLNPCPTAIGMCCEYSSCESGDCLNGVCSCPATSSNNISNGCACDGNANCASGNCYGGICQAPEADGMACQNDGECSSGYCDSGYCCPDNCECGCTAGLCNACCPGAGESGNSNSCACDNNSDCVSGNCYGDTGAGICQAPEGPGAVCTNDGECSSDDCYIPDNTTIGSCCPSDPPCECGCTDGLCNTCCPGPEESGNNLGCLCYNNSDCLSGNCYGAGDTDEVCNTLGSCYCQAPEADGMACQNDGNCMSNNCVNGICQS